MAETTDHPHVPPDAVIPQEALAAQAPASSETYQPLSLLAMAGFGLAIIYSLIVLVGGAVSLFGHTPWLIPYWTFLLPIAVLIICRAARTRIALSEGTLSGLAFTTWGSRLAVLFSLPYAAYYFATFLAVRGPAIDCANDFFQKIKTSQLEQAFLLSQDIPTKGMDKTRMRNEIETRFNQPIGGVSVAPGTFTRFCQERFVRFLEMDGEEAKTVPTGVSLWEYTKGGYRVILNYHVTTSLVEFDMKVETLGRDPKPGEPKGRQWLVFLTRGETSIIEDSVRKTPKGNDFEQRTLKARGFAQEWVGKANDVAALEPAERESYTKLIRGYDTFWAGSDQREALSKRIRTMFQSIGEKRPPCNLTLQSTGIPLLREREGRTTAWIDVNIRLIEEGGVMPQYIVDADLVLSADTSEAAKSSSAWRADALEIKSGRTSPEMRRMQRALGVPNVEEAGFAPGQKPPDKPPPPPAPRAIRPIPP